MTNQIIFNKQLIDRYDRSGPRYTSYPTVLQFSEAYDDKDYLGWVAASNDDPIPASLSLYLHIPFCNTICYYCGCSKIVTKDTSQAKKYIKLLQQEIAIQGALFDKTRPVVQIHWGGGTPTFLDDDTIGKILGTIRKHFTVADDDQGEFAIEVDPRTVDHDRITTLRSLGFNRISFGVQDFNPEVQQAVNRVHTKEQIFDCIKSARANNFHSINLDLMYGLPKQTISSFDQTIQTTIEADPDRIAIYNYAHLPEMFKPQRRIDEKDLPSAEDKLKILQIAIEKLQAAGYVYIGMDHFAKETDDLVKAQQTGTLQRNFQGYSTHANSDIIAMGITSISSIGDNYCQNVKTLEEYENRINNNRIPVYRGLELEADDLLRREVINQLMCNFKLDITRLESKWGINFSSYFESVIDTLHTMAEDGLLKIDDTSITVTLEGRLLVRSVCMLFDRYLQEPKTEQRFSKII
jgi:oxygen-independent coproporphyrinogen-3 oxidase